MCSSDLELLAKIKVALGGRAAEEIVYGEPTTGAEGDIQQLTEIARQMVGRWGMSAAVGLPAFFILAVGYGALYGVAFVVLPGLAGEAAPPAGRGAALNTFGLGSDLAQLLGPWGLGLAAATWGFGGALVAAAVVPLLGAAAYLAHVRRLADRP